LQLNFSLLHVHSASYPPHFYFSGLSF
jgi:hypothetical protein